MIGNVMISFIPNMDYHNKIADFIKISREKRGFSQKMVALQSEIESTRYNRFESEKNKSFRLNDFMKLLRLYGPEFFNDFLKFLEENKISVSEIIDDKYQGMVQETEEKYITMKERFNNLQKEADSCKKDIDMLKKIIDSKEETIDYLKRLVDLKQKS